MLVGREVRIVGTAHVGQPTGNGYTTLLSSPGSQFLSPLTVAYEQVTCCYVMYSGV